MRSGVEGHGIVYCQDLMKCYFLEAWISTEKKLETLMTMLVCRLSVICCVEKTVMLKANSTVISDIDGNQTVQFFGCRLDQETTMEDLNSMICYRGRTK